MWWRIRLHAIPDGAVHVLFAAVRLLQLQHDRRARVLRMQWRSIPHLVLYLLRATAPATRNDDWINRYDWNHGNDRDHGDHGKHWHDGVNGHHWKHRNHGIDRDDWEHGDNGFNGDDRVYGHYWYHWYDWHDGIHGHDR